VLTAKTESSRPNLSCNKSPKRQLVVLILVRRPADASGPFAIDQGATPIGQSHGRGGDFFVINASVPAFRPGNLHDFFEAISCGESMLSQYCNSGWLMVQSET
jgi:hypothetical protein